MAYFQKVLLFLHPSSEPFRSEDQVRDPSASAEVPVGRPLSSAGSATPQCVVVGNRTARKEEIDRVGAALEAKARPTAAPARDRPGRDRKRGKRGATVAGCSAQVDRSRSTAAGRHQEKLCVCSPNSEWMTCTTFLEKWKEEVEGLRSV